MHPEAYIEMADTESHHWWFCGRRNLMSSLIENFNLPNGARILDVGCGTGGNLQMLSRFGHVSAIEMDSEARAIALEKTEGRFDIRLGKCPNEIPFSTERFDLICLFDVLEHIDADLETLIAIKSFLSKGGRILITVPANPWLWGIHDTFLHHKRRYSLSELSKKVHWAGFRPTTISYFNTLLFPLAVLARLKDRLFRHQSASGSSVPPLYVNRLFSGIFGLERFIIGKYNMPFGVSIVCVLQID